MVFIETAWNNLSGVFGESGFGNVLRAVFSIIGGIIMLALVKNWRSFFRS